MSHTTILTFELKYVFKNWDFSDFCFSDKNQLNVGYDVYQKQIKAKKRFQTLCVWFGPQK